MSLWVDKHRPKELAKLDYHDALTQQLSTIAESGNMPHMLFYGPSGAGKKTRIMALLKGIFGNSVIKKKETFPFISFQTQNCKTRFIVGKKASPRIADDIALSCCSYRVLHPTRGARPPPPPSTPHPLCSDDDVCVKFFCFCLNKNKNIIL